MYHVTCITCITFHSVIRSHVYYHIVHISHGYTYMRIFNRSGPPPPTISALIEVASMYFVGVPFTCTCKLYRYLKVVVAALLGDVSGNASREDDPVGEQAGDVCHIEQQAQAVALAELLA